MGKEPTPARPPRDEQPKFNPFDFKFPRETKTRYTPWLVVRSVAGDTGTRPDPSVPAWWESPDVWVQNSLGINQPVVGQPNDVFARVSNFGLQHATGVLVYFYWINPSLAILTPNLIGRGWANIPSGWSVVVQCPTPWVPVMQNGGHECLFAQAYIPVFDPLSASPFYPWADRHVAQRNVDLVTLAAGQSFARKLTVANTADVAQELTIEVRPVVQKTVPPVLQAGQTLRTRIQPPSAALPATLRIGDERAPAAGAEITRTAPFKAGEIRTIEIGGQVPQKAAPGETFVTRVIQRAGKTVMGGYTFCVIVGKPEVRR
jgi:hypothetical protein